MRDIFLIRKQKKFRSTTRALPDYSTCFRQFQVEDSLNESMYTAYR